MLSLSQIAHIVMLSLGSVLANAFCGLQGLGLYRAAFDLSSRLWLISNGLGLVVFPRFSHLMATENDSKPLLTSMAGILDASWTGYIAVCTFSACMAPYVLPLIGIQPEAAQLFMLLLLGTGMNAHGTLSYELLQASGKYIEATLAVTLGSITLALAFAVLYGQMGLLTLGWAWILSQFIYALTVDVRVGVLAHVSLAALSWHAAFKLLVALAATVIIAACITPALSTKVLLPLIVCMIALAFVLQALRVMKHPAWESQRGMIDISIVTPTYNRAALLPRVWKSLRDQKSNFEWVVVDDGSTDDTSDIVKALQDSRIVYIRLPGNRGVNAARNAGAHAACGRFILFLDSDDELYPGALARMSQVMEVADQNIGVCAFTCIMAATGKKCSQLTNGRILDEQHIVCHGDLQHGGDSILVYRRGVFEHFHLPEDLRGCEQVFVYQISQRYRFLTIDEPGSIVHRQGDNLSGEKV